MPTTAAEGTLTCSTASPSFMTSADWPLVCALEEYNRISRSATFANFWWTFSFGSTKCSISAMVNSLRRQTLSKGVRSPLRAARRPATWHGWVQSEERFRSWRSFLFEPRRRAAFPGWTLRDAWSWGRFPELFQASDSCRWEDEWLKATKTNKQWNFFFFLHGTLAYSRPVRWTSETSDWRRWVAWGHFLWWETWRCISQRGQTVPAGCSCPSEIHKNGYLGFTAIRFLCWAANTD